MNKVHHLNNLTDFEQLLSAFQMAGIQFGLMIDGGAGFGLTSSVMSKFMSDDGLVHAFEPNPNNHKFFKENPKIKLHPEALYSKVQTMDFFIPRSVSSSDYWSEAGLVGYSSLGALVSLKQKIRLILKRLLLGRSITDSELLSVHCSRLDGIINADSIIDFIKLDLQGGEYEALKGFGTLLDTTNLLWIEFTGDWRVLSLLWAHGFKLYDSNYMTIGISKEDLAKNDLDVYEEKIFSNNELGYYSLHREQIEDFYSWFSSLQKLGFVQTDILAVNKSYLEVFDDVIQADCIPPRVSLGRD